MRLDLGQLARRHGIAQRGVHDPDGAFAPRRVGVETGGNMLQEGVQVHQEGTGRLGQKPRLEGAGKLGDQPAPLVAVWQEMD
jgi:hypothetical protein